ncbi:hypothetical protein K474DRAFT_1661235 [Panus rudis PR-1116 ss-1]|nr:hypothetical protein K474DRAFT_1661235 [Panus rudis PR-1116 ss-1]
MPDTTPTPQSAAPAGNQTTVSTDQLATLLSSLQTISTALATHIVPTAQAASASSISQAYPATTPAASSPESSTSFPTIVSTAAPSTTGMSLPDYFHNIEPSVLLDIVRHKFEPSDLYKLDPQFRDKEERTRIELDGDNLAIKKTRGSKDYSSLESMHPPLYTYFMILSTFALSSKSLDVVHQINSGAWRYLTHLSQLNAKFQWPAVLSYHLEYHRIRRREMARGDYSGWGKVDDALKSEHLFGQARTPNAKTSSKKTSPRESNLETCNLFNKGLCTSPCKYGRTHKCSGCGSSDHGKASCSKN